MRVSLSWLQDLVQVNEPADQLGERLSMAGFEVEELEDEYGQRLTFHPSHFNALGSPNPVVVEKTIKELNAHSKIMDLMGLSATVYNKINIHIAGAYGDKQATLDRWISNYYKLDPNTQMRLTVENDDKENN